MPNGALCERVGVSSVFGHGRHGCVAMPHFARLRNVVDNILYHNYLLRNLITVYVTQGLPTNRPRRSHDCLDAV